MEQRYTSAETSINASKLPALVKKGLKMGLFDGVSVLDYGCGKYTGHVAAAMMEKASAYYPYDPYNQGEETNAHSLIEQGNACQVSTNTAVICSNVLNVIMEDDIIIDIIRNGLKLGRYMYVTVYTGKGDGVGRPTKKGCFQRNEKLSTYVALAEKAGARVCWQKDGILCLE